MKPPPLETAAVAEDPPVDDSRRPQSGRSASVRAPKLARFREGLRIDVNVVEESPVAAMASPLGHYATRKLPTNAHRTHPVSLFAASESASDPYLYGLPFLEYGMIVSIVCDDRGGVVACEGFASRSVRLERLNYSGVAWSAMPPPKLGIGGQEERKMFTTGGFRLLPCAFRDCLFEVVPKMAYEATMALDALRRGEAERPGPRVQSTSGAGCDANERAVGDLKFKSDAERRLNAVMYKKLMGSHVTYGHTIQMRHIKSGKFLSLDSSSVPIRGSEHIPVFLDDGSPQSHLIVLPRFKLRSKGAPIQLTDQILLSSAGDVQPFSLYVSNRSSSDGNAVGVVGSATHSSQWRIVRYDIAHPERLRFSGSIDLASPRGDKRLHAGVCVRFFHLESNSWLRFSHSSSGAALPGQVTLQYYGDRDQEEGLSGDLSIDSLWEIERPTVYEGGIIKWNDALALRHVVTGQYLAISSLALSPTLKKRSPVAAQYSAESCNHIVAQSCPQSFRFVATALADEDAEVEDGDVVLLQHKQTKGFIHSVETHASTMADIRLSSQPLNSGTSSGGSFFTLVNLPGARDEDAFKILAVSPAETSDTLRLVSYKERLVEFLAAFSTFKRGSASPSPRSDRQKPAMFDDAGTLSRFQSILAAIQELTEFCSLASKESADQLRDRQDLFRTHHYIELLVDMMKAPFRKFGGPFELEEVAKHNPEYSNERQDFMDDEPTDGTGAYASPSSLLRGARDLSKSKALSMRVTSQFARDPTSQGTSWRKFSISGPSSTSRSEINTTIMQHVAEIVSSTNILLVHVFRGNRENELRIIRTALPTLMELLGNGFQTSLSLSFLLRENRNLVESITAYASIVRNFFELIKTRGKSIRYMQFLVAMCTSRGRGVPKTQEAICDFLFNPVNDYRDHVIIPVRPSHTGFDIYVPAPGDSRGIARNVEAIFNKHATEIFTGSDLGEWMSLSSFYEDYHLRGKFRGLGRYCYGLFRLYVALCLDRNYVSIDCIQAIFPRDNLMYSVMDSSLSRSLRAILMDLLRVTYVDCEPQKVMTCPNYTRVWTEASLSTAEALASLLQTAYPERDAAFFVSVRRFCLLYFRRQRGVIAIDATPENELTLAVLRLSRKLVEFGMFLAEEDLRPLVSSLFDLLDERTDVIRGHTKLSLDADQDRPHAEVTIEDASGTELEYQPTHESLSGRPASRTVSTPSLNPTSELNCDAVLLPNVPAPRMRHSVILDGTSTLPTTRPNQKRDGTSQQYSARGLVMNTHRALLNRSKSDGQRENGASNAAKNASHREALGTKALGTNRANQLDDVGLSLSKSDESTRLQLYSRRHQMDDVNHVVMEIKDEICAILQHIDSIRVDFLISTLLGSFQAQHAAGFAGSYSPFKGNAVTERTVAASPTEVRVTAFDKARGHRALFPPRSPAKLSGLGGFEKLSPVARWLFDSPSLECKFSLSYLANRKVTTIFMQMLMYEYPPLVSKALELLLRQYNQHDDLLKELDNVQLLVTDETIAIYNKLKDDVDSLRRLAETTEVWMDLTSKSDYDKADSACQLLRSLTELIRQGESGMDLSASDKLGNAPPVHDDATAPISDDKTERDESSFPIVIEKELPNRKLKYLDCRYKLNASLGRVSCRSVSHSIFPSLNENAEAANSVVTVNEQHTPSTVSMEARRLLRNLRAAHFVLNMMLDGAHFFEGHVLGYEVPATEFITPSPSQSTRRLLQARQRDQIRAVFAHGMQFLAEFCAQDPENQRLLASHVTMIAQYVHELEIAQQLLVAIYTNNAQLYKMVPTDLVNIFVTRLIKDGPDPRYLLFLETLTMCDEQPVLENQLLVMFQLVKAVESAAILQLFDDSKVTTAAFSELMRRYAVMIQGQELESSSGSGAHGRVGNAQVMPHGASTKPSLGMTPGLSKPGSAADFVAVSRAIEYHARLLHLFAACATGKNSRVQEICQQVVPVSTVLDLLWDENCTEGMQVAALRYLNQVYLIADEMETPSDDLLLRILTAIGGVCEARVLQYLKDTQVRDANKLTTLSLRKKRAKRGKLYALPKAPTPHESTPLYVVMHSVVPTLLSFFQQFPRIIEITGDESQIQAMRRLQQILALLFVSCSISDWKLTQDAIVTTDELVYTIDKALGTAYFCGDVYPGSALNLSVELVWSSSLMADHQRIDLSGLDLDTDLTVLLQLAMSERRRRASSAASMHDLNGTDLHQAPVQELSLEKFLAIPEEALSESSSPAQSPTDNTVGGRNAMSHPTSLTAFSSRAPLPARASTYLLGIPSAQDANDSRQPTPALPENLRAMRPLMIASSDENSDVRTYGDRPQAEVSQDDGKLEVQVPDGADGSRLRQPEDGRLKNRVLHKILPARYVKLIVNRWQTHPPTDDIDHAKAAAGAGAPDGSRQHRRSSSLNARRPTMGFKSANSAPSLGKGNGSDDRLSSWKQSPQSSPLPAQQNLHDFTHFFTWLCQHPRVGTAIRDELNHMVQGIVGIEASLREEFDAQRHLSEVHLTFDLVVRKLVTHVAMFQDAGYLKMNLTLLDVFCRMIYAIEDPERRHQMQITLDKLGVTRLVVQLIARRDDDSLFASCIDVGVALLDGMNAEVQEHFFAYWCEPVHAVFFERIRGRIEKACALVLSTGRCKSVLPGQRSGASPLTTGGNGAFLEERSSPAKNLLRRTSGFTLDAADGTPDNDSEALCSSITSIFRFLQLLCEGHYLNAQRSLIAQPLAGALSVNLVESTTSFLLETYLGIADLDVSLLIQLFETIAEFCQGPCEEAQETVANYKFISAVNTLLTHSFQQTTTISRARVRQVHAAIVITLLSLLEGRRDLIIHAQLVQELNFEALKANLVDVYVHFLREHHGRYAGNPVCSADFYLTMGFNVYFLLQQLADHFPQSAYWIPRTPGAQSRVKVPQFERYVIGSACDENRQEDEEDELIPDYNDAYKFFQANSAKVEVVWDHVRFARSTGGDASTSVDGAPPKPGGPMSVNGGGLAWDNGSASATATAASSSGAHGDATNSGALIPFYFPLHPICFCLTEQSKKKLVWQVSRGPNKLSDFFQRCDKLVDEMAHQSLLTKYPSVAWFARQSDLLKRASFILAVTINLIVVLFYRANGIDSSPYAGSHVNFILANSFDPPSLAIDIALSFAGTLQLVLCCMVLVCYLVNSAPLLVKKGWKRRIQVEQATLSKKTASGQRSGIGDVGDADERESFQDTEQLLRSLREREEEYNYFFLPNSPRAKAYASRRDSHASAVLPATEAPAKKAGGRSGNDVSDVAGSRAQTTSESHPHRWWYQYYHHIISRVRRSHWVRRWALTVATSLFFLVQNPRVLYYLLQIAIAILGSYVNKLFFAFHLLDVVNRYQELNNVLRSIVRPAKVLGLTVLLYLVVVYVFAIVGFYFFREDYTPGALSPAQIAGEEPYQCQQLFQCFLISLDQGFKSNGGLGGYLKANNLGASARSYGRLVFDLLYNTILIIMLLNILFGVIIDTFASLRTADTDTVADMQSRCFICSIDAYTFDRAAIKRGFHDHIYADHNMWHYLFLFVHIRKKPITEYNGLELHLAMRMAKKDVSFFPVQRALALERATMLAMGAPNVSLQDHPRASGESTGGDGGDLMLMSNDLLLVSGHGVRARGDSSASVLSSAASYSAPSVSNAMVTAGSSLRGRFRSSVDVVMVGGGRNRGRSVGSAIISGGGAGGGIASMQRMTNEKLEKLESTVESLLAAQSEMREELVRSADCQRELVHALSALQHQLSVSFPASSPATMAATAIDETGGVAQPPTLAIPHAPLTGDSRSFLEKTDEPSRPRARSTPSVFSFDSVVDENEH